MREARATAPIGALAVAGALAATLALSTAGGLAAAAQASAGPQDSGGAAAAGGDTAEAVRSGAELDELTARVADQLRCPVCRNQSVLESSSTLAREMQAEIRRRLARGESPEEVRAYFVSRYGQWILLQPPARGINLLVYVLPVAALLFGIWLVVRLVRRWRARGEGGTGGREKPAGGAPGTSGSGGR